MWFQIDDFRGKKFSEFIYGGREIPDRDGGRIQSYERDVTRKVPAFNGGEIHGRSFWNVQMFYSGALEKVFALRFCIDFEGVRWIPRQTLTENVWKTMNEFKACMLSFNVTSPIIVGISLLRVQNYILSVDKRKEFHTGIPAPRQPLDKDQIILQGISMKNLDNMKEIERLIFDLLWLSFGYEKCPYYNEDGTRNPNG